MKLKYSMTVLFVVVKYASLLLQLMWICKQIRQESDNMVTCNSKSEDFALRKNPHGKHNQSLRGIPVLTNEKFGKCWNGIVGLVSLLPY